jgi:hypothetical protein
VFAEAAANKLKPKPSNASLEVSPSATSDAATVPAAKLKQATPAPVAPASPANDPHAANMAHWLPKMRVWAAAEEKHNDSQQSRRFQSFMERHPPSEDFWNSLDDKLSDKSGWAAR